MESKGLYLPPLEHQEPPCGCCARCTAALRKGLIKGRPKVAEAARPGVDPQVKSSDHPSDGSFYGDTNDDNGVKHDWYLFIEGDIEPTAPEKTQFQPASACGCTFKICNGGLEGTPSH